MDEYLAVDRGGYLYMNNLCAVITSRQDASHSCRDSVQLKKAAR